MLSRSGGATGDPSPKSKRRQFRWQSMLPGGMLLGFLLVFGFLYGERLLPAKKVNVVPVLAIEHVSGADAPAAPESLADPHDAPMRFQASGWIEPDPLPTKATALVDGVIDEVHVLEGQAVKRGEMIATLIDDDARLALEGAQQVLLAIRHEKNAHFAGIPVIEHKIDAAKARATADRALLERARDRLDRLESVKSGAVSTTDLIEARFAADRLAALANESMAKVGELDGELEKLRLEVPMMEARIHMAESKLDEAELALERTRVSSPVDGRVLRLLAAPGQKRILKMDDPDSATVAILYEPERLQVRVDVPLADAAGLSVGQKTRIRCSLLPDTVFLGEVTRIVGEADIQRNTLQAKVRLHDPSPLLRPDMLCRVEFLDTPGGASPLARGGRRASALALFVPESSLVNDDSAVWICDPESRHVRLREITAGSLRRDARRLVTEGVMPGEWVIVDPAGLSEGQRVKPSLIESL